MEKTTAVRKGATWKRFLAGIAIAAATSVVPAGIDAVSAAGPATTTTSCTASVAATIGRTSASTTATTSCGKILPQVSAASGIRW